MRVFLRFVLLALVLLLLSPSDFAQNSEFSGQVTDPQKAAVPNAQVQVENQQTAIVRVTRTNGSGFYLVPYVVPGNYRVSVRAPGFAAARSDEITINVGQTIVINFSLKLVSTSERVNVNATSELMNTTDATVSTVVDRRFVESLPLDGRSFQALINLAPGVQIDTIDQGQFVVNGQRGDANYFTIDGVSANVGSWYGEGLDSQVSAGALPFTNIQGGLNGLVSVDALQELEVLTSTFSPEYGRSPGAQVIVVTRSGTNQFHGSVYEYLRNEAFNANDWFANAFGFARAPCRLNDYGGTFSGPVHLPHYDGRDHTFFFFSYEDQGFELPDALQSVVPTMASRQSAPPAAAVILNAFPKPNGPDVGLDGAVYDATDPTPTHSYDVSFRVDHRFNDKESIFGRFNYSPSASRFLGFYDLAERDTYEASIQTYTVGATQVFRTNVVNELRGNFTRSEGSLGFALSDLGGAVPPPASILWPAGTIPAYGRSIFYLYNVGGTFVIAFFSGRESASIPRQYQLVDNVSYLRGKHQFKFGVDLRLIRTVVSPIPLESSVFFVNPTPTTSGIATLDSGTATELSLFTLGGETIDDKAFSAYAQDSWRISPRFTLTYGTRWEINPAPQTVAGQKPYTACCADDLSNLTLSAAGAPYYSTSYRDFAPRLGFAYQIVQAPGHQLVVRSGAGVFYDLGQTGAFGDITWPSSNIVSDFATPFPVPSSFFGLPPANPIPSPSNPAIVAIADTNFRLPRTYEWNLTLEQSMGPSDVVSVAYVGARARDLLRSENFSNPNPDYALVELVKINGFSSYDSLQVEFNRRSAHGLETYASYTYSHAIDNASSDAVSVIPEQFVRTYIDKGNSDFDVRHTFNTAFVYPLPFPKMGRLANALLHNWSVQGILRAQSAMPFDVLAADPQVGSDPRFNGTARANLVPGQPLFLYGSNLPGGKAANPAAFTGLNANQVQGDLGRNILRGFGLVQLDSSLTREFSLAERATLEFRAEAFNLLNHPNFANPSGFNDFVGAPDFGQAQSMFGFGLGGGVPGSINPLFAIGGPRNLELALRLRF